MATLADQVSRAGLVDRIFSERQLRDALGGSDARRYGLVNRALKDGSLVRIKRGTYLLGRQYRSEPIHPFVIAQSLVPGSYISFESALAYHGWIPEAIFVTASVAPGRKSSRIDTPEFGSFDFRPLALQDYGFFTSVERLKLGKRTALVAQPLRALMDLVAFRKEQWSGLPWLTDGMRIDEESILALRRKDFAQLKAVYKHKAVNLFLAALEDVVIAPRRARNPDHD